MSEPERVAALPASKTAWLASCTRRGQQRDVHDAFGNLAESGEHGLDGETRSDFARSWPPTPSASAKSHPCDCTWAGEDGATWPTKSSLCRRAESGVGEFCKFNL